MNTEYNTVYGQFEKIFKEQAESFIPEDDIKITLKMEKIRFENAEKYNISINKLTGNNLARYTKDAIRRRQPLFFVYYTLSIVTGFCYFLLMWSIAKCIFLYFTGTNKEAFSDRLSFSVSLIFSLLQLYAILQHTFTQGNFCLHARETLKQKYLYITLPAALYLLL